MVISKNEDLLLKVYELEEMVKALSANPHNNFSNRLTTIQVGSQALTHQLVRESEIGIELSIYLIWRTRTLVLRTRTLVLTVNAPRF